MVHTRLLRQVLIRFRCRTVLMAALAIVLGTGTVSPRSARAQTDPVWQHLVDTYADEYPAVYTDFDIEVSILSDTHGRISNRTKYRAQLAVFDVKRAKPYLDMVFPLYGEKVKQKRAWVIEKGGGLSGASAEGGDFHERTLSGTRKELRISIPGLREKGYATVEFETQGRGIPTVFLGYAHDVPLKKGAFTLRWPGTSGEGADRYDKEYLSRWTPLLRGGMHEVSKHGSGKEHGEFSVSYATEDVPARFTDPKVPASSQPVTGVGFMYKYDSWKRIADAFDEMVDEVKIPDKLVKSVRDSLKDASPREAVEALARFLDDPTRLRLDGSARSGIWWGDMDEAIKARKAGAFAKGMLACRLLRALKIDATLVLASSRFLTDLDWRIRSTYQLDATLVWIPSISEDFLWDVAARWVPLGQAGSDLYPEMLVLDRDADRATREFPVDSGGYQESRSLDLTLGDTGSLDGGLSCRFMSYPLESGLDPWDPTVDLEEKLERMVPRGAELSDADWKEPGPHSMRCSPETPAVLDAHVAYEALPAGETGWDVAPFILPLPRELAVLGDPDRKSPLLLNDSYEITDAVRVGVGNHHVVHLPEAETIHNQAGTFLTTWEERPEGVVAVRRLSVDGSVSRLANQSAVAALCKAWRDSQTQTVRVD